MSSLVGCPALRISYSVQSALNLIKQDFLTHRQVNRDQEVSSLYNSTCLLALTQMQGHGPRPLEPSLGTLYRHHVSLPEVAMKLVLLSYLQEKLLWDVPPAALWCSPQSHTSPQVFLDSEHSRGIRTQAYLPAGGLFSGTVVAWDSPLSCHRFLHNMLWSEALPVWFPLPFPLFPYVSALHPSLKALPASSCPLPLIFQRRVPQGTSCTSNPILVAASQMTLTDTHLDLPPMSFSFYFPWHSSQSSVSCWLQDSAWAILPSLPCCAGWGENGA